MWFTYVACTFFFLLLLFFFEYSLTYFCIRVYHPYFVSLSASQCGSSRGDLIPWLIYASQDKLQIGNVREIALSSPRHRPDSKQGQNRGMMSPPQAHTHTHTHTPIHRCTKIHTNRGPAAPSAPAPALARSRKHR